MSTPDPRPGPDDGKAYRAAYRLLSTGGRSTHWLLTVGGKIIGIIGILILIWAGFHVIPAFLVRDNPPVSCQVLGGTWNLWTGWTCG